MFALLVLSKVRVCGMAKFFGMVLLALPVMGASFYGTHIMLQGAMDEPSPSMRTSLVAEPGPSTEASLSGGADIYRKLAGGKNFAAVKLAREATRLFALEGRSDRADTVKPRMVSGNGDMMKLSSADIALQTPKQLPLQVADTAIVNSAEKSDPLENVNFTVMAQKNSPKKSQAVAAISTGPFRDSVDPADFDTSLILRKASVSSNWADSLVTSAFRTKQDKKEAAKPAYQPAALSARILPSGRAFGGFTEKEFQKRELRCMATALYFEARSEPVRGQLAVGQVIMNRVRSPEYPDTICGVIFQGDHRRTGCQFSFACDGKTDRPTNARLWGQSKRLARNLTEGKVWLKDIANSTHYHADYVHPKWRRSMRRLKKIGRHIFYKSPKISTTNTFQQVRS